jgi:tetratricopeptide (TPR) repeat protein
VELKTIRDVLERKKNELDDEKDKAEMLAYDLERKERELSQTQEEIMDTRKRLSEEQNALERERMELRLKSENMEHEAHGSVEERIALERELVKLELKEKEITASNKVLSKERNNVENERITLQNEIENIVSAKAGLAAREKAINQRENEMKVRFDEIVNKSGDMAIKEKELEEMARELRRTQESLEKKARILMESEKKLLEKQKLLAENRARMKGAKSHSGGAPYQKEVFGEFGREVVTPIRKTPKQKNTTPDTPMGDQTSQKIHPQGLTASSVALDDDAVDKDLLFEMKAIEDVLAFYSLNDQDETLTHIVKAQEKGLDSKLIWNLKGNIMLKRGEYEKALECYTDALRRDQNFVITLVNMMSLYSQMMRFAEARDLCNKITMLKPKDEKFLIYKALLEARQGLFDEALATIDNLLLDNEKMDVAWNIKAMLLYNVNQSDEALECCETALKNNPNFIPALNNKGVILYEKGKTQEASECFSQAQKILPSGIIKQNLNHSLEKSKQPKGEEESTEIDEEVPLVEDKKDSMAEMLGELGKISEVDESIDEGIDEVIDEMDETAEDLENGNDAADLYMCPSCGAFVSPSAVICEKCGYDFEEEMEEEGSEPEETGDMEPPEKDDSIESEPQIEDDVKDHQDEQDEIEDEHEEEEGKEGVEEVKEEIEEPQMEEVIEKFIQISGVGRSKAIALYEAGFTTFESLKSGPISEIGSVKGIGKTLAKNIKDQLKKKKLSDN